jgi:hypothetical protein
MEQVECRADHAYPGIPLAFSWNGMRYEVNEVINTWQSPQGKGYRVQTGEGRVYELFYDIQHDNWIVKLI